MTTDTAEVEIACKVDPKPLPLWVWGEATTEGDTGEWFAIPSWRVHVDHDAVRALDLRVHKRIDSGDGWIMAEATTGFSCAQGWGDEGREGIIDYFVKLVLPKLTPEKVANAIAKSKAILADKPPRSITDGAGE